MSSTIVLKRTIITCLFTLSTIFLGIGQTIRPMQNLPTPSVADLGTFGETPVDHYTGQPNISIPIYELHEDNISVPITLNYYLSSVKANIHSSWVGLGWNLSAGGYITRSVRGAMDEKKMSTNSPGFYDNHSKLININSEAKLLSHQPYFMEDIYSTGYELTADEFTFNFCGYSGSFYLNKDGGWSVISDDDIKVEFNETSGFIGLQQLRSEIKKNRWNYAHKSQRYFNQFTLITPDGIRYTFGGVKATEYSISYYRRSSNDLIPTSWYLSKIQNPEGNTVTFSYEIGAPVCEIKYIPYAIYLNNIYCEFGNPEYLGYRAYSGYLLFPVYLKEINSSLTTISFKTSNDTENSVGDVFLTLSRLGETPCFTPYTGNVSFAEDFSSFFENINTSILNTQRKNLHSAMIWKKLDAISILSKIGENEKDDWTCYFGYSKPKYRRVLSTLSEYKGRHKSTPTVGDLSKKYTFQYNNEDYMPEPVLTMEDHWGYYNGATFSVSNDVATVLNSKSPALRYTKAETLKEIRYPTGGKTVFEYEANRYEKVVSPSYTTLNNTSGTGGGLRVKSITSYSDDNTIAYKKNYYYTTQSAPPSGFSYIGSGILKNLPTYTNMYYTDNQAKYWYAWGGAANAGTARMELIHAGGFVAHGMNNRTPSVGYSSVIEETLDGNNNSNGYVHYRFSNYDADIWGVSHFDEPMLYTNVDAEGYFQQFSSKSQERGKLMAEDYYNAQQQLEKSRQYKYTKSDNNYLLTIHQEAVFFCTSLSNVEYALFSSAFKTYTYSYLLSEIIEKDYYNSNIVENKTQFAYNANKLISKKTNYNSNGEIYTTSYKYSGDLSSINPYQDMRSANILNTLVEERVTRKASSSASAYLISSSHTQYKKFFTNIFKPYRLYLLQATASKGESSLSASYINADGSMNSDLFYLQEEYSFNNAGKPDEIIHNDGTFTCYLWEPGYTYPVAEIKNVTYDDIQGYTPEGIRLEFPNAHVTTYSYTHNNKIKTKTDPRGVETEYEYDNFGRLIRIKYGGGTVEEYDIHGRVTTVTYEGEIIEEYDYKYKNQ